MSGGRRSRGGNFGGSVGWAGEGEESKESSSRLSSVSDRPSSDSTEENGLQVPARSPLRSSLVKEGTRRPRSPNPVSGKTVSFSTTPAEKKVANLPDCLDFMSRGSELIKVRSTTRRYRRHFTLDSDHSHIRWTPTNKKPHKAKIPIGEIREVRLGGSGTRSAETRAAESAAGALEPSLPEDSAFCIVWGAEQSVLDVVATTAEEANIWVTGLVALSSGHSPNTSSPDPAASTLRERWLRTLFHQALPQPTLDRRVIPERDALRLIKKINPRITQAKIFQKLRELDSRKEEAERGHLEEEEFVELYKELGTRPEIYFLMVRSANKDYLTAEDLQVFLESEQGLVSVSTDQCRELIQLWEPSPEGRKEGVMTVDGFTAYLMSEEGGLFDPTQRAVCQDMTQPLHHYFIATSHNSYLVEDQLKGPSSALGFVRALKRGARLVELDIWSSEDSLEAVVCHGHTLTSKLPLSKALAPIRDFAFSVSDYPLILKVEQHLTPISQRALAQLLKTTLAQHLYIPSEESKGDGGDSETPSPEALRGKILLMSKKLPRGWTDAEGEVSEEDESSETNKVGVGRSVRKTTSSRKAVLAKELSDLVPPFLVSRHLKDVSEASLAASGAYAEVSNISESLGLRLGQTYPEELAQLAANHLARVYPNTVRVDSSNLNPQEFWNFGLQAVGLNYQTPGLMMDLQEGKFAANGGCGYVLKPPIMRDPLARWSPRDKLPCSYTPQLLHLKVISGWQLVRPRGSTAKGDSADPYVVLEVFGVPGDCAEERTKTVHNDAQNPSWDESFQFQVAVPEVAILRFLVLDDDFIQDDFIGQLSLPFHALQSGYRHLTLRDNEGEELENSSLFVHVALTNRRGGGKPRKRGMSVKRGKATKVQTGLKTIGVKTLDDLFKATSVSITEAVGLKTKADLALTEWQTVLGMGSSGTVRQGLRLLHARFAEGCEAGEAGEEKEAESPALQVWQDDDGFPHVSAKGTLSEASRRGMDALGELVAAQVAVRKASEGLETKLEEGARRIAECGSEEISGACAEAGLRGHKATRATENFAWNLRLLRGHLDLLRKTEVEARASLQLLVDTACHLGLLTDPCTQPCIHQARPNFTHV